MNFDFEQITSRKNPKIIRACSLEDKKHRDREGLFAFEGEKLFGEALSEGVKICEVYFTEKAMTRNGEMLSEAQTKGARLYLVSEEVYSKLTYEKASQGIFAVAEKMSLPVFSAECDFSQGYIVLESVRDPSNVGAILRSCAALGSSNILLTSDCADVVGYKTLRAAMGAVFMFIRFLSTLSSYFSIGSFETAETSPALAVKIADFAASVDLKVMFMAFLIEYIVFAIIYTLRLIRD